MQTNIYPQDQRKSPEYRNSPPGNRTMYLFNQNQEPANHTPFPQFFTRDYSEFAVQLIV